MIGRPRCTPSAGRVDRAVAAGDRRQPRLEPAQRHLVAPVEPFLVGPALVDEGDLAADVADLGRSVERCTSLAQRVRLPEGVGVGEGDDPPARDPHRGVLRPDLAAARQLQHGVGAGIAGALRRGVGRAVAGDDDLQPVGGIGRAPAGSATFSAITASSWYAATITVTLGSAASAAAASSAARGAPTRAGFAGSSFASSAQQQPVADLRVDDERSAEPEDDLHDEHGRDSCGPRRRRAPPTAPRRRCATLVLSRSDW